MLDGVGQFAESMDALACGAVLIARDGTVVHVNPRACAMTGFAKQEVVGRRLIEFYSDPADQYHVAAALDKMAEASEGEFHIPMADGGTLPVVISGRIWNAPLRGVARIGMEQADYYAITLTDISSMKKAEADLRNQYRIIADLSNTILSQALNLRDYSHELEERVSERTADLHRANMDALYMLAIASESKDQDTGDHVRRMQKACTLLAREMGLGASESERIGYSAILHDVGKIHVPDHILNKPGPLMVAEREAIQEHTLVGERILAESPFFEMARRIARSHHENWDGSGYPDRGARLAIPLEARIVHLADVYDALTTSRVYKSAWTPEDAAGVIEESSGCMFDPEVVRAFVSLRARGELRGGAATMVGVAHRGFVDAVATGRV